MIARLRVAAGILGVVTLTVTVAAPAAAEKISHKVAYLPQGRHSSETGFGVGAKFKAYSLGLTSGITTRILAAAMYTEKSQYSARLEARAADPQHGVDLRVVLDVRTLPERFYGIGPDTPADAEEVFEPHRDRFHTTVSAFLWRSLKLGVRYEFENIEMEGVDAGGALAASGLPGVAGASVSGLGFIVGWDTRNDGDDPTHGSYHQLYALRFDRQLFSSHTFDAFIADLRWYAPVHDGGTLAYQAFTYHVEGDAPVTRLSSIGGRAHSRGYRRGRYLDNSLFATQVEYRWDVRGSIEMVAFAGAAHVLDGMSDLRLLSVKPTVGLGVRAQPRFLPARARFDVALGINAVRLYIGFGEAF